MILRLVAVIAFSLVAGIGSAWWSVRSGMERGGVENGSWSTNENIGSTAAGAYLRAGIAVGGLLALNRSETIYYTAVHDSDGAPLDSSCVYAVEGTDPAARWWSVTAYGADHFLIPNPRKRYAVGRTDVVRAADGRFSILVGGPPQASNWLASGKPGERFSLTLRLYNPEASVAGDLVHAALPSIRRVSCA